MINKTAFKKTLYLFNRESNTLLRSNWEESPIPFRRFLDRIESEIIIKKYLDNCVDNHTPEDFDAAEDVKAVARNFNTTFATFSPIPEEESAEVYLILKEAIAQSIQGHSCFYYGFTHGDKYADMYKGFLDKVARRLIANITEHLTMIGIEMGLESGDSVTNNISGSVQNLQFNQSIGNSTINATQKNGISSSELSTLLDAVISAAEAEIDNPETIKDIRNNVEAVQTQMESDKPKRGILKSSLGFLGAVNGGAQFTAAVAQIVEFMNNNELQFPLPN